MKKRKMIKKSRCEHDWSDITVRDEKYGNTYMCSKCGEEKFEPEEKLVVDGLPKVVIKHF